MKFFSSIILSIIILPALLATGASAGVIDFKAMAESGGTYGESIWSTLTIIDPDFQLDVTGTNSAGAAYAYLDAGNAGLGVCGVPTSGAPLNTATGSTGNLCNPSSDDNITFGEFVSFQFNVDVIINDIWLNNNHDGDKSLLNNTVNINGAGHTFTSGPATGPADFAVGQAYLVSAGEIFTIGFFGNTEPTGEQLYVSKIDVSAAPVPEPSALILLGIGLLGLGLRKTRQRVG